MCSHSKVCHGNVDVTARKKIKKAGGLCGVNHLGHAILVAQSTHEGQSDKVGQSYFEHCRRVASSVTDEIEKVVAYLHDVVEKGKGWTQDRLREESFSPDVVGAVDAMRRRAD
jgi:(p)ppGpp synthase/HD superfamily hydrolase